MSVMSFIALLPAVLAVLAFVVYRLLSGQKRSDDITKQIVQKLKADAPKVVSQLEGLSPRQISQTLDNDQQLKMLVGENNFRLLNTVLRQEFIKSLSIYSIVTILFIIGIAAFIFLQVRPQAVALSNWNMTSTHPDAENLPVDLDELLVEWQASGPAKDFTFFLENVQTGMRSDEMKASSDGQSIRFPPTSYQNILSVRERNGVNRVRVVARGDNQLFRSDEFLIRVGIEIGVYPITEEKEVWITALIDNRSISNYTFEGALLVYFKDNEENLESYNGEFENPKATLVFSEFDQLNWATAKFAYFGPDDPRLVRQQPMEGFQAVY